jgi:hypothetical protein
MSARSVRFRAIGEKSVPNVPGGKGSGSRTEARRFGRDGPGLDGSSSGRTGRFEENGERR